MIDDSDSFKGYPASPEVWPTTLPTIPFLIGITPNADVGGDEVVYLYATGAPPPPVDMSVAVADLARSPDFSHAPDLARSFDLAGPPADLGGAPSTLFSDSFSRNIPPDNGLGAGWSLPQGFWYDDGRAVTDSGSGNLAVETAAACGDCRVQADVIGFGSPETAIVLRAPSAAATARYDLALLGDGRVRIRRIKSGTTTVLGTAQSGLADLGAPATLSLSAAGAGPVTLTATVNGATKLTVTDSSTAAITAPGLAGLWATAAGVVFDNFQLTTK